MRKLFFLGLLVLSLLLSACNALGQQQAEAPVPPTPTREAIVVAALPTPTNFPRLGTATPMPPTPTPTVTPIPPSAETMFDDATLEELMAGTISSAGVPASVRIVDRRDEGGQRVAEVDIVTQYDLQNGNNLLLKVFILEAGNALRSIRAFSQGTLHADLDVLALTVVDTEGAEAGTLTASMDEIISFLDGDLTVDEALDRLEVTGVFEDFKR